MLFVLKTMPSFISISKKYIPLDFTNPMKNLSLKLEDDIFTETEGILKRIHKTRNRYINEAVQFYNTLHKRRILAKQLDKESKMVAVDSMKVLSEFEKFQDDHQAI